MQHAAIAAMLQFEAMAAEHVQKMANSAGGETLSPCSAAMCVDEDRIKTAPSVWSFLV